LKRALGDLHAPSEVWLRTGTHRISNVGATPTAPLRARQGFGLRGGFAGHELRADERDPLTPNSVLTGDVLGDDAPGFMNRTDNVPGLLSDLTSLRPVHQPWLIERVTFRGAYAPPPNSTSVAMWLHGDGSLSRCTFEDNDVAGRLLCCSHGDVVLRHVEFRGNRASIVCGTDDFGVGATWLFELTNCLVEGDRVTADCISGWGSHVSLQVASSTIASNTLVHASGTALRGHGPTSRVVNSLLWNNARAGIRDEAAQLRLPAAAQLAYTTVSGWTGVLGGQGCNGLDPSFRDPLGPDGVPGTADDDLRLAAGSPGVDAGDTGRVPAGLDVDLDGRPRVVDDPAVPDTGVGGPPVVDRGAYER
jgi:hypothetical protein